MSKLSESQRRVLERGYCILFLDTRRPIDVPFRTWSGLCDRGWITHKRSNLDAPRPFERYVITPAGRLALANPEEG